MKLKVLCDCENRPMTEGEAEIARCLDKHFAEFDKETGQIVLSAEAVNNMMTDEQKQEYKKNDEWFKDEAYKQNSD